MTLFALVLRTPTRDPTLSVQRWLAAPCVFQTSWRSVYVPARRSVKCASMTRLRPSASSSSPRSSTGPRSVKDRADTRPMRRSLRHAGVAVADEALPMAVPVGMEVEAGPGRC